MDTSQKVNLPLPPLEKYSSPEASASIRKPSQRKSPQNVSSQARQDKEGSYRIKRLAKSGRGYLGLVHKANRHREI